MSFMGCILASRAIWMSDFTSAINNQINLKFLSVTSYPFLLFLETSKKYI
jgi:hypoxanthine-guanine phosphoribosyltransferase